MIRNGWIPPRARTREQMILTREHLEQCGTFAGRAFGSVREPDRVILAENEIKATGNILPRIKQLTGSCVGAGGGMCYGQTAAGDVVHRGDHEEVKLPCFLPTYGKGREIAGMRGKGEGSFGGAQAKACQPGNFGLLPVDDPRMPKPTIRDGWLFYTESLEMTWSHPSAWPIREAELKPDSSPMGIHDVAQVTATGEAAQALAQGYGISVASMFGTRGSRVQGEIAVAKWDAEWAHQMSVGGYIRTGGKTFFWIQNQWGAMPQLHTPCPTMSKIGVNGGFWIEEGTFSRILASRDAECFAHTATGGFPTREFKWNHGWRYYD